ncbi:hypothetical protein OPV22_014118 [Ensete ventricosum]|uniref:Uncharacterized protein n=1 Tax=Ensete ventricosum TaxID=4639 RepID=A0AAV8QX24_ENSVE|nr:hypothetical protein OPV22_014118 [Ensete ventricosum]
MTPAGVLHLPSATGGWPSISVIFLKLTHAASQQGMTPSPRSLQNKRLVRWSLSLSLCIFSAAVKLVKDAAEQTSLKDIHSNINGTFESNHLRYPVRVGWAFEFF